MKKKNNKIILCDVMGPKLLKSGKWKLTYQENMAIEIHNEKIFNVDSWNKRKRTLKNLSQYTIFDHSHLCAIPGLYDMHFHWVQDDVREMPKDSLLEWLSKYTWPTEAKYKSKSYSLSKVKGFSSKLMEVGTLGGACYGSLHPHTVSHALKHFKGDFILGNVLMTENSPKYLTHSKNTALKSVLSLISKYGAKYAITPRFAPTLDFQFMKELGKLLKEKRVYMQTHLSENKDEISWVLSLYQDLLKNKKFKSYTGVYYYAGLLGPRSLLGHGIHLSQEELSLLSKTKSTIVSCPTSNDAIKNGGLGSGLFDFKRCENFGVKWFLGSDIGAGPHLSMFDVMKSFVKQNKIKGVKEASFCKAFLHSSTLPAKYLGIKNAGAITKDSTANFLLVKKNRFKKPEEFLAELMKHPRNKMSETVEQTYFHGECIFKRL